jgi:hypothetical protein
MDPKRRVKLLIRYSIPCVAADPAPVFFDLFQFQKAT